MNSVNDVRKMDLRKARAWLSGEVELRLRRAWLAMASAASGLLLILALD